jgi:hypothetical protein
MTFRQTLSFIANTPKVSTQTNIGNTVMSKYFQYIGFTLPEESLVSRKALLSAATYVEDKLSKDVLTVARNDKDEHNLALYILALHNPDVLDVRIHFKNEVAFCDKALGQKLHARYMSIHRAYHKELVEILRTAPEYHASRDANLYLKWYAENMHKISDITKRGTTL